MRGKKPLTPLESVAAFEAKVDKNAPFPVERTDLGRCWLWTGGLNGKGYGNLQRAVDRKPVTYSAHRFAYQVYVGPIPDGLELDHLCRVRNCVNPDHLEPVTRAENIRRSDMSNNGARERARTHCPQGHPYDEANTYHYRGCRQCITCRNAHTAAANARRKAAA